MTAVTTKSRRFSDAFTLVELLVVIAIVSVLVAIGTGALIKFRDSANKVSVGNSLRKLQFANTSYANDHNGKYVSIYGTDSGSQMTLWPANGEFLSYLFSEDHVYKESNQININVPQGFFDRTYIKASGSFGTTLYGGPYGYNHKTEQAATGVVWGSKGSFAGTRINNLTDPVRTAAFALCTNWILNYSGRLNYR